MTNPTSLVPGKWTRFQLPTGPTLPSGQKMIFYVLAPPGWVAGGKYRCLVWEHEDEEGNRAYNGDDALPQACQADAWFNNSAFMGAYPWLILVPACDQTTGSDVEQNFGGWTPPNDDANEDSVALCAQYAVTNLGADPDALVVGGASLGGIGSWAQALDHNTKNGTRSRTFCAFIPMAGVIERNGYGVGPTAAQFETITGVPIFAVHGAGDTTSPPNWDLAVWAHFANGAPTVSGPAGAQAGTSAFRLLFDPNKGHDVWDSYCPLPAGKPIWDWAAAQTASGTGVTPPVTITPSPDDTRITPGTGSITDATGNVWTITPAGTIARNNVNDTTTKNVTLMALEKGVIWQQNTAGSWYSWLGSSWSGATTTSPLPGGVTPPPPPPGTNPTPAGFFKVSGAKILRPDGSVLAAGGFNLNQDQMDTVSAKTGTMFPGTRILRIANRAYSDPSTYAAFIQWATAQQTLMIFEDHTGISAPPLTGSQLAAEVKWYAAMAAAYKANPYVAFGTFNEPGNGNNLAGIATQEKAIYDAIRGAGSFALVFMEEPSGGNPGLVGSQATGYDGKGPMTPALYATMYNICWDLHYYGWVTNFSTDIPTIKAGLQGSVGGASGVAGAQSITSLDGLVPVVIGEFGNSTTGGAVDANGTQVCQVVGASGMSYCAWAFNPDEQGDQMVTDAGQITPYGQLIAGLISATAAANPIGVTPPPPPPPPPTGVTVASVQAEIDAINGVLTGAVTALAKVRADTALLP
jgi:hypothetical protein